jgi:hypothetical protein
VRSHPTIFAQTYSRRALAQKSSRNISIQYVIRRMNYAMTADYAKIIDRNPTMTTQYTIVAQ